LKKKGLKKAKKIKIILKRRTNWSQNSNGSRTSLRRSTTRITTFRRST